MEKAEISDGLAENDLADSCEIVVNDAGAVRQSGTGLTQRRSGSDLVPSAFDLWAARRFIIAERLLAGADTPLGHRCSNMVEMIENYQTADSPFQVSNIKRSLIKTVQEIAEIKGRKALPAPAKMLEEA